MRERRIIKEYKYFFGYRPNLGNFHWDTILTSISKRIGIQDFQGGGGGMWQRSANTQMVEKVELKHLRRESVHESLQVFWGPRTSKEWIGWRPSTWVTQRVPIHHVIPKVEFKEGKKKTIKMASWTKEQWYIIWSFVMNLETHVFGGQPTSQKGVVVWDIIPRCTQPF
jgi:hypothetical protein